MIEIAFKFKPRQYVKVNYIGLECSGRIVSCTYGGFQDTRYTVEYADESGNIQSRQFYEDELVAA